MKEELKNELIELTKKLWAHPELNYREFESSKLHIDFLRAKGFYIEEQPADIETAYIASFGSGKPVIAFVAEMDALEGMDQMADSFVKERGSSCTRGHGCGHHILGAGSIGAAILLKDYLEKNNLPGTVKLFGCPAEESGSGKAYLVRDGYFDNVDAAITWHPGTFNIVSTGTTQSCSQVVYRFNGKSAHAGVAPHMGRSALDALELMNVGTNFLREHLEAGSAVSYAITNAGTPMANVIPDFAEGRYMFRAPDTTICQALMERVDKVAKGAAMMTETDVDIIFDEGNANFISCFRLEEIVEEVMNSVPMPEYTDEELAYLRKMNSTSDFHNPAAFLPTYVVGKKEAKENYEESPICTTVIHSHHSKLCNPGSTDVGDISWVTPTVVVNIACFAYDTLAHSWQWVSQGKSSSAMKGMFYASEVLFESAKMLIEDESKMESVREDFRLLKEEYGAYKCMIPKYVKPHFEV